MHGFSYKVCYSELNMYPSPHIFTPNLPNSESEASEVALDELTEEELNHKLRYSRKTVLALALGDDETDMTPVEA